jgi:protein-tyrosine phosphatase
MKFMNDAYTNKQKIFVHCKSGMARSASIVLCHLVANEKMSPEDALKLLREKRAEVSSSIITFSSIKHFLAAVKKE